MLLDGTGISCTPDGEDALLDAVWGDGALFWLVIFSPLDILLPDPADAFEIWCIFFIAVSNLSCCQYTTQHPK